MDARVEIIIYVMRQGLADQLSVGILSKQVNLSPARLQQLFKRETGRSPVQYLRSLRMQKAEQLLRSSFLSIKEIASRSGAGDVSHFARDFKKYFGLTPSGYRSHNQSSALSLREHG